MSSLLIQSCSATKNQVTEPTRAMDVYDGYFFKIIKKAKRERSFCSDIDIRILSAEHGILHPEEEIIDYDRRMTSSRADELRQSVTDDLHELISQNKYEKVVMNMGSVYTRAVGDITEKNGIDVTPITGDGIGTKGRKLKRFIRNDANKEVPA